jgi:hypothetical protein
MFFFRNQVRSFYHGLFLCKVQAPASSRAPHDWTRDYERPGQQILPGGYTAARRPEIVRMLTDSHSHEIDNTATLDPEE